MPLYHAKHSYIQAVRYLSRLLPIHIDGALLLSTENLALAVPLHNTVTLNEKAWNTWVESWNPRKSVCGIQNPNPNFEIDITWYTATHLLSMPPLQESRRTRPGMLLRPVLNALLCSSKERPRLVESSLQAKRSNETSCCFCCTHTWCSCMRDMRNSIALDKRVSWSYSHWGSIGKYRYSSLSPWCISGCRRSGRSYLL